jgi:hypothetical protein
VQILKSGINRVNRSLSIIVNYRIQLKLADMHRHKLLEHIHETHSPLIASAGNIGIDDGGAGACGGH